MHIGFDVSQTGAAKAGCGFFAHAMLSALLELAPQHRYSLFPSFGDFYFDDSLPFDNPYVGADVHYGPRHRSCETAAAFWARPDVEACLGRPDLVHSNNFWCPAQFRASRLVYTLYDMGFVVDPGWTTEANRVGCFDGVFRSSVAADWVVAISEASRAHYLSVFPHFPASRIRVVHPCSRFAGSTSAGKRPKALERLSAAGFWLNVGTVEPRKNQRRLVEAHARYLAAGGAAMPLVIAGGQGWLMDDFPADVRTSGDVAPVNLIGYVSDEELIWLYRNCCANLFPSFFEGFGLPVLEGMGFGAPTVGSRSASMPEVAGNAAILLDPEDTDAWAQTMLRLAASKSERDQLSAAARLQAARFDWKRSAGSLLQLYEEAVASPRRQERA